MGASWGGSWQGTKWGWCASHLCSCSRCLQVPASTGALRGGTGPKWYSGRTACGLALGGWEVAEGMVNRFTPDKASLLLIWYLLEAWTGGWCAQGRARAAHNACA